MSSLSGRPLLAVCASLLPFLSFAQAPTTFNDTLGVTSTPATNIPPPIFRNPRPGRDLRSWVIHWNEVAINASGFDHTPVAPGENRVFGEQVGPGRSARAMAIVHVAVFDSIIAVNAGFKSYTGLARVTAPTSTKAAVAENGQSRIYLGIHWSFDNSEGITQGQQVADYVWFRTYRPTK